MRIAYTLGGATYEANGLWTCADDHCVILVFDRTLKAVKPADAALGLILLSRDRVQFSETSAPKPRNDCWFTASCSRVAPQNNRVAFGTFSLELVHLLFRFCITMQAGKKGKAIPKNLEYVKGKLLSDREPVPS